MAQALLTSPANPRLKAIAALRRRRVRDQQGVTMVDGIDELELALAAGVRPKTLVLCPDLIQDADRERALVERAPEATVLRTSRSAFEKVAYREGPDGVLAVVPAIARTLQDLILPVDPLLLVAEGIEKPGNLGAMLRTADAAGVDAVVAADPVTDWGNPNVVRSSKGTVFSVPVATDTTEATLQWLQEGGVRLLAATPDSDLSHTEIDLTGPVAIAVGTEKEGLTDRLMDAAEHRVRIPMHGQVNSLNVATSAAILLYEAERQRNSA
ncbi:TrmH family RNA methyltransferase [Demetria terragena]|uniref:TrmH family RNA methyltransferase n=1 Tax=Demetria terragena TaxID=63959 RepID=UPI00037BDD6A|nr:RNA methyltransferase [Demetria terragena]